MGKLDQEFQKVLARISQNLLTDDIKPLRFMLRSDDIPKQELEDAKCGEDLFDLMMKYGLLSKTSTNRLTEMLVARNLKPCADMLEKFTTNNQEELEKAEEGLCNIQDDMVVEHFKETNTLTELQDKLQSLDFVTLSGLLGCGKSQLALKYACSFHKDHLEGLCWRIACQTTMTFLNSLKKLADALGLEKDSTKQDERVSNDESLISLQQLILSEFRKTMSDKSAGCHLMILDDISEETKHPCEKFKDSLLKLNIKTIVTTWDSAFCDEENLIIVKGFTEKEAVEFLRHNRHIKPDEEKNYQNLAKQLGYLPMALNGARSCMRSLHLTPKRFIKYLKESKSLSDIDKYVQSSSENRKLFEVLMQFLEIMKKDEGEEVFDMVLALQFLGSEDIPILLFDFLPLNNYETRQGFNTENFIQILQKFSFGILRGEDDDRFITTHLAVIKTIDQYTSADDKIRLIKKLLTALLLLMDKDNHHPKDYRRNNNLLHHAISVLQHTKTLQQKNVDLTSDFELNILLTYVYDLVGYTYNFFGILKNAGEYSTAARLACFALIGLPEDVLDKSVEETCTLDEHYSSWETFAEHKASLIFQNVNEQIEKSEIRIVLDKLAKHVIVNKYRGQDHIEMLEGFLEHKLEEEYFLTESEYEALRSKGLAIPEDQLGCIFLFELIIQVFYTYGRRIFYLGDAYEIQVARKFSQSLFLAHAFSKKVAEQYKDWNILYVMLTEMSGTLEQMFDDKADLQLKSLEKLEKAASQFKKLSESNSTNFVFGIVKSGPDSFHHRHICYKRLVRCYTSMAKLTSDEEKLKDIHEKANYFSEKLKESQWCYRQRSDNLRMAECYLMQEKYEEAEEKFKMVAPDHLLQCADDKQKTPLNFHELQALKGLTKCYVSCDKKELARELSQRIISRLELTKEKDELEHFKKMIQDLNLSD